MMHFGLSFFIFKSWSLWGCYCTFDRRWMRLVVSCSLCSSTSTATVIKTPNTSAGIRHHFTSCFDVIYCLTTEHLENLDKSWKCCLRKHYEIPRIGKKSQGIIIRTELRLGNYILIWTFNTHVKCIKITKPLLSYQQQIVGGYFLGMHNKQLNIGCCHCILHTK